MKQSHYIEHLEHWTTTVRGPLPHLSGAQATVLALLSFGMVLARSCALSAVVVMLAPLLEVKENTLRQRLREFCYAAKDKRGQRRCEVQQLSLPVALGTLLVTGHSTGVGVGCEGVA